MTGATGAQGGALVVELRRRGVDVRALTRRPDGPAAQLLRSLGCEVVGGDLADEASLRVACAGVQGVYSVQNYWEPGVGYAGEVAQGRALAQACRDAGVAHLVQASIAGCDVAGGLRHFESKHAIEQAVDDLGVPRTFLRAVFFLENFVQPVLFRGRKRAASPRLTIPLIASQLDATTSLHMTSVADIGWFAAEAFTDPAGSLGQTWEIAGDTRTAAQLLQVLRASGRTPVPMPAPIVRSAVRLTNPEMARQFEWNNRVGWHFDLAPLRARHPGMRSLEDVLTGVGSLAS